MNKFKDTYNPKIDFRFLAFTNMNLNQFESTYELKKVFNGEKEPVTQSQVDIKSTKIIFEIFKDQGINKKTIKECADIFNVNVSNYKIDYLIDYMNEIISDDYYEYACKIFRFIIKNLLFGSINSKIAILVFNTIMYNNNILPIILHPLDMKNICKLINSGLSLDSLKEILNGYFNMSVTYNTPHRLITKDEIYRFFGENKEKIKKSFDVKHISLTGSYANGLYNEYSDIDLIVSFKNKEKKSELKNFLKKEFGVPVDLVLSDEDFSNAEDLKKYREVIF